MIGLWSARIAMVQTAGDDREQKCSLTCWLCVLCAPCGLPTCVGSSVLLSHGFRIWRLFPPFPFFAGYSVALKVGSAEGKPHFGKGISGILHLFVDSTHNTVFKRNYST